LRRVAAGRFVADRVLADLKLNLRALNLMICS